MKRPPIVAILGHVDHGKSTLLDTLRKSRIAALEPGGITQSIGAYRLVAGDHAYTFIDTPGHEAFANMRSRGAQVADIGILVVAADDGVRPQTIESISHLTQSNTPFLVAINKIDVSGSNPDRVKSQLVKHGVAIEGYGGTVPVVEISAKLGTHLPDLLEMIWLMWELQETPSQTNGPLEAPVIDSQLDAHSGPLVSVIIRRGTIAVGDELVADTAAGKVRALISDSGVRIKAASPGDPVQILGFRDIPPVGAVVRPASGEKTVPAASPIPTPQASPLPESAPAQRFILKADTPETKQVLRDIVPKNAEILQDGVGGITESDVLFARSTQSVIVGFRVKPSASAQRLSERENVRIITDNVIYKLLDQLDALQHEHATPPRHVRSRATIVKVFDIDGQTIAGCLVQSGKFSTGENIVITDKDQDVGSATIAQLKKRAKTVPQVKAREECGMLLVPPEGEKLKFTEGNAIISFQS